jgi:xanthine/CO dehydrogenase XdhC/CoxF family maturation factor
VKQWQETEALLDRLRHLADAGRAAALAVVVRIEGSVYRRPGAKMLVEDDGTSLGGVSGGCLEEDVRLVGHEVMRSGQARLRRYETGADDTTVWGLGLGCNGTVEVFVQPVATEAQREVWGRVRERLRGDQAFAVRTVVAGPGTGGVEIIDAPEGASRLQASGPGQVFTDVLRPPPHLLVCGAGDDARPLVKAAAGVGFRVLVADHRRAYLTAERFPEARALFLQRPEEVGALPLGPQTHAVVMTHSLKHDREWARRLVASEAPYVGLLGPRERSDRILADIGVPRGPRLYGPVGLDLGAEGPEQVAVSIVAEVLSVCARRTPGHLREKEMAVHA